MVCQTYFAKSTFFFLKNPWFMIYKEEFITYLKIFSRTIVLISLSRIPFECLCCQLGICDEETHSKESCRSLYTMNFTLTPIRSDVIKTETMERKQLLRVTFEENTEIFYHDLMQCIYHVKSYCSCGVNRVECDECTNAACYQIFFRSVNTKYCITMTNTPLVSNRILFHSPNPYYPSVHNFNR